MTNSKPDQHGFATIESVLVIVIIALVGFTGWYVYHAKQNSDKVLDAATNTSNNAGPVFAKKSASSATDSTTSSTTATTSNSALESQLDSASSATNVGSQDMAATNTSLNDQSTMTSVPQ